jgi:predicted deacylase
MPSYVRYLAVLVALAVLGFGGWYFFFAQEEEPVPVVVEEEPEPVVIPDPRMATIGSSVEGRTIESYTFGTGPTNLLFVGGIHGGYEWNSVLLAYEMIDHLTANSALIPRDLTVTIVPSANPDGVFDVLQKEGRFTLADVPADEGPLGNGRFNANGVDLNRNFDCKWAPESTWRGNVVSAGTGPFSEPEAQAVRAVVEQTNPVAVIFWHSQSNAVYASECHDGILPGTRTLMNTYARAAGYPAVDVFDAYTITGDAEGWLASIGIPAVTVELSTHTTTEWDKNLAGTLALFEKYGK